MRNIIAAALLASCLLPASVFAQDATAGKAEGQFVVGESLFPLTIAYANAEDDVENSRTGGPRKSLTLLFSMEPVPKTDRGNWFALGKRAREGSLHAIQLRYDPAKKELFGATVFYVTPGGKDSPLNISLSGSNGNIRLDNLTIKEGTVSGTAQMKEAGKWATFDEEALPKQYTFLVSFSAPIVQPAPVTANLTGRAALASPQVALATKFFKACSAGDIAAIRRLALPNAEMESYIQKEGIPKAKALLRQLSPSPAAFARMPKRVVVRGETSTVIAGNEKARTGAITLKMIRKNGKWVVTK